jgi:predicted glycoside hydrolase/deacetylase ChbG (UPF0249 family)
VAYPDVVLGFLWAGNLDQHNIRRALRSLPNAGTCELMCHPGVGEAGARYRHWGYRWGEEYAALVDPQVARILEREGAQLISYRDLANS